MAIIIACYQFEAIITLFQGNEMAEVHPPGRAVQDGSTTNPKVGDGTVVDNSGPTPSHVYTTDGVYVVTLMVEDNDGLVDSNKTIVSIGIDSGGSTGINTGILELLLLE